MRLSKLKCDVSKVSVYKEFELFTYLAMHPSNSVLSLEFLYNYLPSIIPTISGYPTHHRDTILLERNDNLKVLNK